MQEIRFGKCIDCEKDTSVNCKKICPACVFKRNHGGKSQAEIYQERRQIKQSEALTIGVNKIYGFSEKPRKNSLKQHSKEKLDRRAVLIKKDEETYKQVFDNKPDCCEECGVDLPSDFRDEKGKVICRFQYSHILSKGAFLEFRRNAKNFNRFCFACHQLWEFGDRSKMKINDSNQILIQELLDERNNKRV